ncbi:MAG TPA: tripartite tricarboxylate transporter substrate-binding protein [Pirellulales bacterium]|nr:tripartite tricarboxylate transporter substrate-binding protein [Pirellulales bacterium]
MLAAKMTRLITRLALAGVAISLALATARAQDYPTRPIRMVVAYPPGGGVDAAGRVIGQKLGEILGQPVVIENRPGASGALGAQVVANSAPDGYTILISPGDFFVIPILMPQMTFDPSKELLPVAMISSNPLVVVAAANAPFSGVKEMLEVGKRAADGLAYATPGVATVNHVVGEWIGVTAQMKMLHVPYRGGADAALALATGSVPMGIVSPPAVYPSLVDSGKIKVLALTANRPAFLPTSWPTLRELGLPIEATLWLGIFAPIGTPDVIVSRLDDALERILADGSLRKRMNDTGVNPEFLAHSGFVTRIHTDTAHYNEAIQRAGIHIEQ